MIPDIAGAVFWALIFLCLIHEVLRGARRMLPAALEGSSFFRSPLPWVAMVAGALCYAAIPAAAAPLEGGLLLAWGAFVGVLSSAGHEVIKAAQRGAVKGAEGLLSSREAPPSREASSPASSPSRVHAPPSAPPRGLTLLAAREAGELAPPAQRSPEGLEEGELAGELAPPEEGGQGGM